MRRWFVTAAALITGAATTGLLLWYGSPERGAVPAYVLLRDVPAGGLVGLEAARLEPVRLPAAARPPLGAGSEHLLQSSPAAHDLRAGQLIQAGDLAAGRAAPDRRLVLVPLHEAPPLAPGDRIDLLLLSGGGERSSVVPFVLGLEVRAVVPGGVVVAASSRAASGLVYAGAAARLAAVVAEPASRPGQESTVSSIDEAAAAVRQ